jgi:hypothetical protein
MRLTSRVARVNGVDLVYVSADGGRPAKGIASAFTEAMERISVAKGGFGELVGSHLRFVAALNSGKSWVVTYARGYISSFDHVEVENPHVLACRLVWAATVIRLSHDAFAKGNRADLAKFGETAHDAQLRFVRQFPDAERWVDYLESHRE